MLKNNYLLMIVAIVLLLGGLYLGGWIGNSVSTADRERCEKIVTERYGADSEGGKLMLSKCTEPGMVAMMDAQNEGQDAQTTASNIGKANRSGFLSLLLAGVMVGAGIGAFAKALMDILKSKSKSKETVL